MAVARHNRLIHLIGALISLFTVSGCLVVAEDDFTYHHSFPWDSSLAITVIDHHGDGVSGVFIEAIGFYDSDYGRTDRYGELFFTSLSGGDEYEIYVDHRYRELIYIPRDTTYDLVIDY